MIVVRKHAPTPRNMAPPKLANPLYIENIREPKASMSVRLVSSIALPVLEKTVGRSFCPSSIHL